MKRVSGGTIGDAAELDHSFHIVRTLLERLAPAIDRHATRDQAAEPPGVRRRQCTHGAFVMAAVGVDTSKNHSIAKNDGAIQFADVDWRVSAGGGNADQAYDAIDRAVKSAEQFKLDGPLDDWRALRDEIHADVCEKAFDAELNSFVQAYGSKLSDASLLLIPLVGFLPATDPRVKGTVEFIEKTLLVDGFVLRYDSEQTDDGLPPGEGAFLACSFWLADTYVLLDRCEDAKRMFERLLTLRNDLGLLAEGYDPHLKRQVGNFPQAFSHIALLSTAFNLGHAQQQNAPRPADQRTDGAQGPPY